MGLVDCLRLKGCQFLSDVRAGAVLQSGLANLSIWGKQKDGENLLTDEKLDLSLHAGPRWQARSMLGPKVVMVRVGGVGRSVEEWKSQKSGRVG